VTSVKNILGTGT